MGTNQRVTLTTPSWNSGNIGRHLVGVTRVRESHTQEDCSEVSAVGHMFRGTHSRLEVVSPSTAIFKVSAVAHKCHCHVSDTNHVATVRHCQWLLFVWACWFCVSNLYLFFFFVSKVGWKC